MRCFPESPIFHLDLISIELVEVEGTVALVQIDVPVGMARILGEVRLSGKVLYVDRAHVEGLAPGSLGRAGSNDVLRKLLVVADVEQIVIQGATRTSGKYNGKVPRPIVFPR